MAKNGIFIWVKIEERGWAEQISLTACKKAFPNQIAEQRLVDDTRIAKPKSEILTRGFKALQASQNPTLWISHHGKKDFNEIYRAAEICIPENMARLIYKNAKPFLNPRTSSFGRTLQIYQITCYASRGHIQSLASELRSLGLRDFKIWGVVDKLFVSDYAPYFSIKFDNASYPRMVTDNFWKKTAEGDYLYADCIHVDRDGIITEIKSVYTCMNFLERMHHAAKVARNKSINRQRMPQARQSCIPPSLSLEEILKRYCAPTGQRVRTQRDSQKLRSSAPQLPTRLEKDEQALLDEIISGRTERQAYLRQRRQQRR